MKCGNNINHRPSISSEVFFGEGSTGPTTKTIYPLRVNGHDLEKSSTSPNHPLLVQKKNL